MSHESVSQFSLHIAPADGQVEDAQAFEELALELRAVLESDDSVTRIEQMAGEPGPDGTRSVVAFLTICTFIITVVQTGEALDKVMGAIRSVAARYQQLRQPLRVTVGGVELDLTREDDVVVASLLAGQGRPLGGVRRALIVANGRYDDPALAALRGPSHDAAALADVLGAAAIGGFTVEILTDADERTVRRSIAAFFDNRDRDDLLLLHFSGHGIKDRGNRLHLAARDTELALLEATSVATSFVNAQIERTQARRVVLILDCCFSGAFGRDLAPRSTAAVDIGEEFSTGTGRVVLTASSATEYAFEDGGRIRGDGRPSVFTSALVEGLATGEADLDGDGEISVDELYEYCYRQVRERTPDQTPTRSSVSVAGSLIIARSVRPVRLPDTILEDVASDRIVLRLEAVAALSRLAATARPSLRAAAVAELLRLSQHDDSQQIRSAAIAALSTTPTAPAPTAPPVPPQRAQPARTPSVPPQPTPQPQPTPRPQRTPPAPAPVRPLPVPPAPTPGGAPQPPGPAPTGQPGSRRRMTRKRLIALVAAGAGLAVLIAVGISAIVAAANGDQNNSAAPVPTPVPSGAASLLRDGFADNAAGWDDAPRTTGAKQGAYLSSGAYRVFHQSPLHMWAVHPQKASGLNPDAPASVLIGASARWATGDRNASFGLACRIGADGRKYTLVIGESLAQINKLTADRYWELKRHDIVVDVNVVHRLQAQCTTDAQNAVHLALWVDGQIVVTAIDHENPLTGGSVGLAISNGQTTTTVEAEFDDFTADRL